MKPSLSHAYVKVRWARKQLKDLESVCAKRERVIRKSKGFHYKRVIEKLPKRSGSLLSVKPGATRMPYLTHILSGQIVNGLRSALDYLIAALAELDHGRAKRKTQFPIESSAQGFLSRKPTYLQGLNPAHVACIEKLQPYNGCRWTKRMADLSNLDKHNALIPAKMDFVFAVELNPIDSTKSRPSKTRYKVRMNVTPTVYVSVGQEFALIQAIQEIEAGVTQTLDAFKPEFK